ncbi:MAG: DUF1080 domain-containing protein [Verrucomicrobiae bacterium]|nr:DUF1080 domain-containing protein [Verrucomicrobiae bacterium]
MKSSLKTFSLGCFLWLVAFHVRAETETLFNGTDLSGWKGDPKIWSVVDGIVTGVTSDEDPLSYNKFLIWAGKPVEDFKLTVDLKLTGDSNSGIQYRSDERPELGEYVVSGYQCDMHPAVWANGMLYEEKERGILCKRGMKVVITPEGKAKIVENLGEEPEFKVGEWNTYTVIARGNHLVHMINDTVTTEIWDHQESERALSGTIAFQVHRGPAMKIEIRNAKLERLPKAELVPFSETPVPADAPDVNPPKGKKG